MLDTVNRRRGLISFALFAFVFFTLCVLWKGTPVLRHDWLWPSSRGQFIRLLINHLQGWDASGYGSINYHPEGFLFDEALLIITFLSNSWIALLLMGAAIAALSVAAALKITAGAPLLARGAALFIALFNPWSYNELVAGHLFMLAALPALVLIGQEVTHRNRPLYVAGYVALCVEQPQFYLLALPLVCVSTWRSRNALAISAWIILALPQLMLFVWPSNSLASIQTNLSWIESQSVVPLAGAALQGYFTHYSSPLSAAFSGAIAPLAMMALLGLVLKFRDSFAARFAMAIPLVVLTLLSPLMLGIVLRLFGDAPALLLLREPYDYIGLLTYSYLFLSALATRVYPAIQYVLIVCAGILLMAWLFRPPSTYWVAASSLPVMGVAGQTNTRFALLPAFQPLQLNGQGSGLDPDAIDHADGFTALNEAAPSFPVDAGLAEAAAGNSDFLRRLSVSRLIARPAYSTNETTLAPQLAIPIKRLPPYPVESVHHLRADPELVLQATPVITAIPSRIGDGDRFFGDMISTLRTPKADPNIVDASITWVDARLAFLVRPELAQAIGGVVTTSSRAELSVHGRFVLAYVQGQLEDTGRVIATSAVGYRWVSLSSRSSRLTCAGICAIAAISDHRPFGRAPIRVPFSPVPFKSIANWLIIAHADLHGRNILRYNVRYDRSWLAIEDGHTAPHFPLDLISNGWRLRRSSGPTTIVLINLLSAAQLLCESIGTLFVLTLIWRATWPYVHSSPCAQSPCRK